MYVVLRVNYRLCLSDFSELECSTQIFEKYSGIKFHEKPSARSGVVPCGQTDGPD
jgi:hypothetical protein